MRLIPTKFVTEDAVLADDIYTIDGRTLLRKGTKLTSTLIEKINQNHVYSIYINDKHSENEIHRIVSPLLRLRGYNLVKIFLNL